VPQAATPLIHLISVKGMQTAAQLFSSYPDVLHLG
jgi:hypothetical protein